MKMNRWPIGLGVAALLIAAPLLTSAPVMASLQQAKEAIAQTLHRPDVKLQLSAEKQVTEKDLAGQTKISWQALAGKVTVQPGDVLRYTMAGHNAGESGAKNLAVTQPIPRQMAYVLGSATDDDRAKTTYSIDNGQSFVAHPTVQVTLANGKVETRPAPAEAYTHVRWQFKGAVDPNTTVQASYQAKVR